MGLIKERDNRFQFSQRFSLVSNVKQNIIPTISTPTNLKVTWDTLFMALHVVNATNTDDIIGITDDSKTNIFGELPADSIRLGHMVIPGENVDRKQQSGFNGVVGEGCTIQGEKAGSKTVYVRGTGRFTAP